MYIDNCSTARLETFHDKLQRAPKGVEMRNKDLMER